MIAKIMNLSMLVVSRMISIVQMIVDVTWLSVVPSFVEQRQLGIESCVCSFIQKHLYLPPIDTDRLLFLSTFIELT